VERSRGYYRETFEESVGEAARFCMNRFDPDYLVERARAGGRASKRRPKFTPDLLVGLEHLSRAEQAQVLGCSVAMVKKLRAQLKVIREA
jgi:hypothetical protein